MSRSLPFIVTKTLFRTLLFFFFFPEQDILILKFLTAILLIAKTFLDVKKEFPIKLLSMVFEQEYFERNHVRVLETTSSQPGSQGPR